MTGVTKLRLGFHQQVFLHLRMVRRMAGNTRHTVLRMQRIDGLHVLGARGVAAKTAAIDFLGRGILESEDFGLVPTGLYVRFARSMTSLATLVRRACLGV